MLYPFFSFEQRIRDDPPTPTPFRKEQEPRTQTLSTHRLSLNENKGSLNIFAYTLLYIYLCNGRKGEAS